MMRLTDSTASPSALIIACSSASVSVQPSAMTRRTERAIVIADKLSSALATSSISSEDFIRVGAQSFWPPRLRGTEYELNTSGGIVLSDANQKKGDIGFDVPKIKS